MTPEQIVEALKDRNLVVVAEKSGVPYNRVCRLRRGLHSPSYETIAKLSAYLEANR